MAFGVAYALFVTPIVVKALGQERYGVWSFLNGLMGYSSLLYLGVGSALVKYIATYTASHNQASINRLTSVAVTIFAALGGVALLVFSGLSPFVDGLLADDLPLETARSASITCALLGVQLLCLFPTSAFIATLMGHDRFDLANLAQIGTVLVRFLLVGIVVEGSYPLVRLATLMAATNVGELLVARALAYRVDPSLRVAITTPRAEELRILYGFGVPAFLITFALRLISYTDTTVIGVVLGAASVGLYALPLQIVEYARMAVTGYSGVLLARIAVLHATGDGAGLRRVYLLNLRVAALIASFLLVNVMWLGVPFLNSWVGPTFAEPARWVIIWLSLATFLHVFSTWSSLPFYHSMQILRLPVNVLIVEAMLNLVLSIMMAKRFGISGVALATLIPAGVSFAVLPRRLARTLSVSTSTWVRSAMLPAAMMGIAVSASHWLMGLWFDASSFPLLALRTIGTLPGAIVVVLVTASREERTDLRARLRKIRRAVASGGMSAVE